MTPKEKAKELVNKMYGDELYYMTEGQAKQCALIAVEEILKICVDSLGLSDLDYWQDVKEEIELL